MLTIETLRRIAPQAKPEILLGILDPLNKWMPQYGVTSPLRQAHFLAQLAHESAGFRTMYEYASGAAYEGRRDLGNVKPGDGKRYKGRGLIQLTGRSNYITFGERLGLDLAGNPDLAAQPETAVRVALEYWKARALNTYADKDDILTITRRINGGTNGLADRKTYLARAKAVLGASGSGGAPSAAPAPKTAPAASPGQKAAAGTVAAGAAAGTAAKAGGFSWADAIGLAFAAGVVIVTAVLIYRQFRKED